MNSKTLVFDDGTVVCECCFFGGRLLCLDHDQLLLPSLVLGVKVGTKEQNRGTKKANSMILLLVSSALLPSQV